MSKSAPPTCPTPCDDDCDATCHEVHTPLWKRTHMPENCLAASRDPLDLLAERLRTASIHGGWLLLDRALSEIEKVRWMTAKVGQGHG